MQQVKPIPLLRLQYLLSIVFTLLILSGCGGGGSNANQFSNATSLSTVASLISSSTPESSLAGTSSKSTSSSTSSISSFMSSADTTVSVKGIITYDYVPHYLNHIGLNYSAIEQRPVRGAVVDLIDELGQVKSTINTTIDGAYSFEVPKNSVVKIRVKAQILSNAVPSWDFKVTDNTSNNALYALEGALTSVGTQNSTRNLNAASGWDGTSYSSVRAAAPFAILDNIYTAVYRISAVGNKKNLRPLELRWSTKNTAADGDTSRGEIGTSYYDGTAIYILGDANNDTDEYDAHVLLHEWGHYLEAELFRTDSIGGDHSDGELLDLRVAMSEGFANAFCGMMINDINYADASGAAQASGFSFSIGRKNRANKGFFNEGSVGSILYNYYTNGENKKANDFAPIFSILSDVTYTGNEALTSIFLFSFQLKNKFPEHILLFSNLLQEQNIFGADEYGVNESNSGGLAVILPIYKTLSPNNIAVNACSSSDFGKQNKLGNSQFFKLNVTQFGSYNIRINKSGGADVASKPEFILYQKGEALFYADNNTLDNVSGNLNLSRGNYIVEVYDLNNHDSKNTENNTTCFNVRVAANQ